MARDFSRSFYNSKAWAETRSYILKRDNYLCVLCGAPAEEVHHIIHLSPQNIDDVSITMAPANLQSLCRECHFAQHRGEHGTGRQKQEQIESIISYEFDENGYIVQKAIPPGIN